MDILYNIDGRMDMQINLQHILKRTFSLCYSHNIEELLDTLYYFNKYIAHILKLLNQQKFLINSNEHIASLIIQQMYLNFKGNF